MDTPPTMMVAFLYIGAGIGMGVMMMARKESRFKGREENLTRKDLPYTIAMVVLDIIAPILMSLLGYVSYGLSIYVYTYAQR